MPSRRISIVLALVAATGLVATRATPQQGDATSTSASAPTTAAASQATSSAEPSATAAATTPAAASPGSTSAAGETAPPAKAPKLVAESPIVDIGRLQKGERGSAEFTLANQGDATLKIKSVSPSCGCTVASFDSEIEPGATGKVRATLDTASLAGGVAKSITVLSNDPKTPRMTLTLRAEIVSFIEVSPGYVRLLQVQTMPTQPTVVSLWSGDGTPFEVVDVRSPEPWVQASARRAEPSERRAGAPDDQWRLEVSVTPDAPLGPLADRLVVRTTHPRLPELEVPLSGFVRPVLQPTPAIVDFGAVARAAPDKARFVLKLFNFGGPSVELRGASVDLPFLAVSTSPEDAGRRFRIELRLAPDAPKGKFEGTLKVETTSPTMPVVEVPVRGKIG